MLLTIIIVLFSLVLLTALHELGHFLLARKFGVRVEEFGIGYPPRIFGKKIGQTIYSLNLLPFGAFVRILGDEETDNSQESFSQKTLWQRALILAGGVVSFWLVAVIIFTIIIGVGGIPTAVDDDFAQAGANPFIQILQVVPKSPAELAGIKPGDKIINLKFANEDLQSGKVGEAQGFIASHKGEEIQMGVMRGDQEIDIAVTPRINPPMGEGALGIAMARVVLTKTAWYKAPYKGVEITIQQTKNIPLTLVKAIKSKMQGQKNNDLQFVGPIGLGQIMGQALGQGWGNFLMLIAMISIWMALFNLLPIPALDGGRLLFLGIELIRRKPVNPVIEKRITAVFFFIMIGFMALVSIKDVIKLF
ncbi:hypothetical protein COX74_01300 [bacterium (Candidatus Gribaldobacteria) CG_4_10_14_0_2_um_filter_41_16]|uniref:PDZ domain-containing protein n=3 Tax=Candidatus Gribaldobacteria TaxID=2798536 RepID=A0A2M7VIN8_9BACT|nr:MAG: hypothetical protein COU03_01030 [bacterium (Candidatus Gribaldobacteria) CG10_big_fil_rev_8_21_14_0_10_41_12]PIV46719.1 MAG: hypothetical protein COS21_03880 [bacterium (Candidatus Gribaldobacteria) CG02_land_8_20_14_3_00_41_15]PJA01708.1 MAG: hypothetical protein COX74_01300 [bacterium (Candidatus Gribaldobacteria) CG_4_10_14_0_2_um_filter_41_16]